MSLPVQRITREELDTLSAGTRLVEAARDRVKVRATSDGRMIKFFYLKRRFSSAAVNPYARRFCRNGDALRRLGIAAPECEEILFEPEQRIHVAIYPMLAGESLRELAADAGLVERLAGFLARLHAKGVLFRSIHFNNILLQPSGEFGLIDITDVTIRRRALNLWQRARNFRHLMHDDGDREIMQAFGGGRFLGRYCEAAGIAGARRGILDLLIRRVAPRFPPD